MHQAPHEHAPWWFSVARRARAPIALAATLLVARLLWLAFRSPLTLSEDEAHYWLWSRHPDWSYYSKGPGVAWLIRASTDLIAQTEMGVRAPAAVATAIGTIGAAAAVRWASPDRVTAFVSALLYACVPALALAGVLMTIDAPYAACWMWAGAFALRALTRGSTGAWLGLGCAVGVGFLFKYTILLIIPGVALGAWATRADRPPLRPAAIGAAGAIASLGLLPVALWNAAHDWPTVRHLLGHLNIAGGDTRTAAPWSPLWPLEYALLQLPVCGGVLALAALALLHTRRDKPGPDPVRAEHDRASQDRAGQERTMVRASVAISLPIFLFYFAVSFFTRVEANWAVAGAATLCPAGAVAAVRAVRRRATLGRVCWGLAFFGGVLATLAPGAGPRLAGLPLVGDLVPADRVTGMRAHAADAARHLDALRDATGLEPFVITDHYGRASLLAFYLPATDPARPQTDILCASVPLGGRPSQFDLWPDTDLNNPQTRRRLAGRPALIISPPTDAWLRAFETVTPIGPLDAEPKPGTRTAYLATGFRGFPIPKPASTHHQENPHFPAPHPPP